MANTNNVYFGPDGLKKYFDPDSLPPLPLVELPPHLNPYYGDGVRIYAKMMTMHPANNVKALPAMNMLESQVRPTETKTIIEYSSGSTVISMSMIARALHGISDTRAYLSNKTSSAKLRLMQFFGLDITLFGGPSQPEPFDERGGIQNARKQAMGSVSDSSGSHTTLNPNQYENDDNWRAHIRWTGPQIFAQLPGINILCAGMGTSGTMTGLGTYFGTAKKDVFRLAVCTAPGDRVPGPRSFALLAPVEFPWKEAVDGIEEVGSAEAYALSLELCREGVVCGPSSGFNLQGLFQMLGKMKEAGNLSSLAGPDGVIHAVFLCCDLPYQYIGEYFQKLGSDMFHPIRNERLANVDLHRYDESWERSPIVLLTDFYHAPASPDPQSLNLNLNLQGPGTIELRPERSILDLRTAADFRTWHLPDSLNIPLRSLDAHTPKPFSEPSVLEAQWLDLEAIFGPITQRTTTSDTETGTGTSTSNSSASDSDNAAGINFLRGRRVLVICYNGDTARVATSVLRARGVEADSLRGGVQALRDHRLWGEVDAGRFSVGETVSSVPVAVE